MQTAGPGHGQTGSISGSRNWAEMQYSLGTPDTVLVVIAPILVTENLRELNGCVTLLFYFVECKNLLKWRSM